MPNLSMDERRRTRRHLLALGAVAGAGLAPGGVRTGAGAAQSSPVAGPETGPDLLIDAGTLLEGTRRMSQTGAPPRVVALMPEADYADGYLPGAVAVDWPVFEVVETTDDGIAAWREETEQALTSLGIGLEDAVVSYDHGTLFAARLWWILHYLGHADNRVLDGGRDAWIAAGGDLAFARDGSNPEPAGAPYRGSPRPEVLAQLAEVVAGLDDPGVVFVDARTPEEYAAGHIPGAVNVNYPRNVRTEPPLTWLPAAELRPMYEPLGVTPDKLVIPYCESGVRSAVTAFTLTLIGYPEVALFTGSWQEWSAHPDLPQVTGDAP